GITRRHFMKRTAGGLFGLFGLFGKRVFAQERTAADKTATDYSMEHSDRLEFLERIFSKTRNADKQVVLSSMQNSLTKRGINNSYFWANMFVEVLGYKVKVEKGSSVEKVHEIIHLDSEKKAAVAKGVNDIAVRHQVFPEDVILEVILTQARRPEQAFIFNLEGHDTQIGKTIANTRMEIEIEENNKHRNPEKIRGMQGEISFLEKRRSILKDIKLIAGTVGMLGEFSKMYSEEARLKVEEIIKERKK
ncbi:MAG: hypothetical protein NUV57_01605, partial [archaeon]|nr:hypothetical protein [archaeon]